MTAVARVVGHIGPEAEAPKVSPKADLPWLSATELAKLIRAEVKQRWPATRFSVRSKSYSGGSSVHVSWKDGPTGGLVEAYLKKYEGVGFNGMDDSTYYCPVVIDGQQYRASSWVSVSRKSSRRAVERAYSEVCDFWGLEPLEDAIRGDGSYPWAEDNRVGGNSAHTIGQDVTAVLGRRDALSDPGRWYTDTYLNWTPEEETE